MKRATLLAALLPLSLLAQQTAADLARSVRNALPDPQECYRVRDLSFSQEDIRFYLTDGYLVFSKAVDGRPISAVFSATEIESGDAEVIVLPPHRSDRQSLASFIQTPNLDEHFRSAFFLLSGPLCDRLLAEARKSGRKMPDAGVLVAGQWSEVARNLSESLERRVVLDLLNPGAENELFFAAIAATRAGNFDVFYDPTAREQILIGQLATKNDRPTFDVWTAFESRSARKALRPAPKPPFTMGDFRIDAALDQSLHLSCTTRAKITMQTAGSRAIALQVSPSMRITEAKIDGQPVEIFAPDSLRADAMRGERVTAFVLVSPQALSAGTPHELEIKHDGDVVLPAGNGVFYVESRSLWYPRVSTAFASYDLTFRYPKRLTLVATGNQVGDRTDGDFRITHYKAAERIRFAGFNLGDYQRLAVSRGPYTIEIFANRHVESSLERKPMLLPPTFPPPAARRLPDIVAAVPAPEPIIKLNTLADEVGGAMEYYASIFGPPPLKTLMVSPIPGAFGQGFPGLVYLSTIAYLRPEERPVQARTGAQETFFSDILAPHEVAHQWWGDLVSTSSMEDDWLMEALANYSALLYMEKRHGPKAVDSLLDHFRANLLAKTDTGSTVESTGPVTWGARLETSHSPDAWRAITYEKGAWILHMLRHTLGDERFFQMLREMARQYRYQSITTEEFRRLAESFLPKGGPTSLESFFETWVYGTGIPTLKMTYTVRGKAPALRLTGTITQTDVDDDFSCAVPIEVYPAKGAPILHWVHTSNEPVTFTLPLKQPAKAVLPATAVLAVRK